MLPMLSVIVPIYKVEQYLSDCIESILSQEYTDYELILVNDGSPDRCGEICEEYAKNDNRIRVIHKENGGVSSARNEGIKIAQGEYILFCDSDDTMVDGCLKKVMNYVLENKSDITLCTYILYYEKNNVKFHEKLEINDDILKTGDFIKVLTDFMEKSIVPWSACRNIINQKLLIDNKILFDEEVTSAEDCDFYFNVCIRAKTFGGLNVPILNYKAERDGSCYNTLTKRNIDSISKVYQKWQGDLKSSYSIKEVMPILKFFSEHYYYLILRVIKQQDSNEILKEYNKYVDVLAYVVGVKKKMIVLCYKLFGMVKMSNILKKLMK